MKSPAPVPQERLSLSFYPAEQRALNNLRLGLRAKGLKLDPTKVLRALIHITSQEEFLAYTILMRKAADAPDAPRETALVNKEGNPSINVPKADAKKLDAVIDELELKEMFGVKRSYVVRARLRNPPSADAFASAVEQFLEEYPDGRSRAARSQRPRSRKL